MLEVTEKNKGLPLRIMTAKGWLTNETKVSQVIEINGSFVVLKHGEAVFFDRGDCLFYNKLSLQINEVL